MRQHILHILFTLFLMFVASGAFATHNRAGEIRYRVVSNLTFEVTIITYTKASSVQADRDTLNLDWGDGTVEKVLRSNGPVGGNGVPQGVILSNDIKYNEYKSKHHTYPGPLPFYVISVEDPNRISSIININGGASVNIRFFIEDTLRIFDPTFVGYNNSPILLYPPIDFANMNDTFYHNPIAFDPDGDSLTFELVEPFQAPGFPVPNYQYPDEIRPGINNNFTINPRTGEIIWATPQQQGIYNIAILITEYRNGIEMGTVLRDMQIIVRDELNDPPRIAEFADTCVVAGSFLSRTVRAFDPNGNQSVELTAAGGPFQLSVSPATFSEPPLGNPVTGIFNWQTTCNHIRRQFYQVVFKAEDNYTLPLVDLKTWIIKVVAPPPENLQANAQGNTITINWDQPYQCGSIRKFIGFSVWRREGSNPFTIDTCETGLAGRGYTKIAENLMNFTYEDANVVRGKLYCYRVLAEFAERTPSDLFYNKVASLPSNEACAELKKDLPIIKNVSVLETDQANGRIFVAWYKPVTNPDNLDTTQLQGPYGYKLYRSDGFNGVNPTEIASFSSQFFGNLNDTSFIDEPINTVNQPYSYQVEFYANGSDLIGETEVASSVFLTVTPSDNELNLSWEENVPWNNFQYVVHRLNDVTGFFEPLDTTDIQGYGDKNLVNDSLYCYYIESIGEYSSEDLNDTLINLSQEVCARPIDTVPPCAPMLMVTNACEDGGTIGEQECELATGTQSCNHLSWQNPIGPDCTMDIEKYYIYYSSPFEFSFRLIDSVLSPNTTTYFHALDSSLAGCYVVTAIDSSGNESDSSNVDCVDNCPFYELPNVFTPNNDGQNDYFTPFIVWDSISGINRFNIKHIDHVDMKIFNRWGDMVYETSNPEINWDGTDKRTGKAVKEGVYYYVCTVYEIRVDGVRKRNEILNGYIHLIRGNQETNP